MTREKRKAIEPELRLKLDVRGYHLTSQRTAVFTYLSRVTHHPTAEEIFLSLKHESPRISLATVYKSLEALVDCGAITKLGYGDAAARYDIRTDQHYHVRCLQCGRIWDLEADNPPGLLQQIKPQPGFKVADYRLEITGYCRDCAASPAHP